MKFISCKPPIQYVVGETWRNGKKVPPAIIERKKSWKETMTTVVYETTDESPNQSFAQCALTERPDEKAKG